MAPNYESSYAHCRRSSGVSGAAKVGTTKREAIVYYERYFPLINSYKNQTQLVKIEVLVHLFKYLPKHRRIQIYPNLHNHPFLKTTQPTKFLKHLHSTLRGCLCCMFYNSPIPTNQNILDLARTRSTQIFGLYLILLARASQ